MLQEQEEGEEGEQQQQQQQLEFTTTATTATMTAAWILHEEIGAPKIGCLIWALIFMQKQKSNSSFSFVMVKKEHWTWASFEEKYLV